MSTVLLYVVWLAALGPARATLDDDSFPSDFMFGVSTSSYQTEGSPAADGAGESIWDAFTRDHPERVADGRSGEGGCESYRLWRRDVLAVAALRVSFYRLSLSWARLVPDGLPHRPNELAFLHYERLLDALIARGIEPVVTLYHWDMPQRLQLTLGGWTSARVAELFGGYARAVFARLGSRVRTWITFNEPKLVCCYGYGEGRMAPGLNDTGRQDYLCGRVVLQAHALAYRIYDTEFRATQRGRVGIALHTEWFEPATSSPEDQLAAETKLAFDFGWFAEPIFGAQGGYPAAMVRRVAANSAAQGCASSRLPALSAADRQALRGSADFLGLNFYTASLVGHEPHPDTRIYPQPGYHHDVGVRVWKDPLWKRSAARRLTVVPWSMRKILRWIKDKYGDINIIITENGYADTGGLEDDDRIHFYKGYLRSLLEAIKIDRINVTGFAAWTLLDNFEWFSGYTEKYGLFAVDQQNDYRRIPKKSAYFYRSVCETKRIEWNETGWQDMGEIFADVNEESSASSAASCLVCACLASALVSLARP